MNRTLGPAAQRRWWIPLAGAIALAVLLAFGAWGIVESRENEAAERASKPETASSADVVKVDADDLARSGVRTGRLAAAHGPGVAQAFATVVDIAPLNDLRNNAAAAQAQVNAAEAKATASRAAWQRAEALYKDGQNMSLAQAQAAEAAWRADAAAASAAAVQLQTVRANARQQFGPALAQLGSSAVAALLEGRRVLLQVTVPGGESFAPPRSVQVQTAAGGTVAASFLSNAVRVDPRIQGPSFFYVASSAYGLQAGMNVTVAWPAGAAVTGALVPTSAVVAWQGQWWVYQRAGATAFRRARIDTDRPVAGGYLVQSLAVGSEVVTDGAQLLLSQELKPQSQTAEGDND